jgi:ATP-dependent protease Clp ATPase subunit
MKSIIYIAILLFNISVLAQKPMNNKRMNLDFTPEQHAELQSKRMTLALDLNQKQQREIQVLQLERAKENKANRELRKARRNSREKPSQNEIFTLRNKNLDAQMAHQEKMKKILSVEQYGKWKELRKEHLQHRQRNKMIMNKKQFNTPCRN